VTGVSHAPRCSGYPNHMTSARDTHDQDSEPPTPDGEEPSSEQLQPDSEPASDPDPDPGSQG
jgi:hypothetical protein